MLRRYPPRRGPEPADSQAMFMFTSHAARVRLAPDPDGRRMPARRGRAATRARGMDR
jgi:hypothetical protein